MIDTTNNVNKVAAKLLGLDETLVKVVNKFFWKHGVKEAIQSASHTSVRIPKIGTLVTSRNKVNARIQRVIKSIRDISDPNKIFKEKSKEDCLRDKYEELTTMLKRRNDIAVAYKSNTDRLKQKYEVLNTSMEESPVDNAGVGIEALL